MIYLSVLNSVYLDWLPVAVLRDLQLLYLELKKAF